MPIPSEWLGAEVTAPGNQRIIANAFATDLVIRCGGGLFAAPERC